MGAFAWFPFEITDGRTNDERDSHAGNGKQHYFKLTFRFPKTLPIMSAADHDAKKIYAMVYITHVDGTVRKERYNLGIIEGTIQAERGESGVVDIPLSISLGDEWLAPEIRNVSVALVNTGRVSEKPDSFLRNYVLAARTGQKAVAPYTEFEMRGEIGVQERCEDPQVLGRHDECVCKEVEGDPETKMESWKVRWVPENYSDPKSGKRRCKLMPPCRTNEFWQVPYEPKQTAGRCIRCEAKAASAFDAPFRAVRRYYATGKVMDQLKCTDCTQAKHSSQLFVRWLDPVTGKLLSGARLLSQGVDGAKATCGCPNDIRTDFFSADIDQALEDSNCTYPCSIENRQSTVTSDLAYAWDFAVEGCEALFASKAKAKACCTRCPGGHGDMMGSTHQTQNAIKALFDSYTQCSSCIGGSLYVHRAPDGSTIDGCTFLSDTDYYTRTNVAPHYSYKTCPTFSRRDGYDRTSCRCTKSQRFLTQPWNQICPETCSSSQVWEPGAGTCRACPANSSPTKTQGNLSYNDSCACKSGYEQSGSSCVLKKQTSSSTGSKTPKAGFSPPQCPAPVTHWTGPYILNSNGAGICCLSMFHPSYPGYSKVGWGFLNGIAYCCPVGANPQANPAECDPALTTSDPCSASGGTYGNGAYGWGCYH
jgi:hypothetical protein